MYHNSLIKYIVFNHNCNAFNNNEPFFFYSRTTYSVGEPFFHNSITGSVNGPSFIGCYGCSICGIIADGSYIDSSLIVSYRSDICSKKQ